MIDRVERILNVEELKANVKAFKEKEERKHKEETEKNLLEINDFLMATQNEIIQQSKLGKQEYKFVRYDNGKDKAYSEEIYQFFEEQGFDVDLLVNTVSNYQFNNEIFFGLGNFSMARGLKYTFTISWKEK